jgi:hypothetical protein
VTRLKEIGQGCWVEEIGKTSQYFRYESNELWFVRFVTAAMSQYPRLVALYSRPTQKFIQLKSTVHKNTTRLVQEWTLIIQSGVSAPLCLNITPDRSHLAGWPSDRLKIAGYITRDCGFQIIRHQVANYKDTCRADDPAMVNTYRLHVQSTCSGWYQLRVQSTCGWYQLSVQWSLTVDRCVDNHSPTRQMRVEFRNGE